MGRRRGKLRRTVSRARRTGYAAGRVLGDIEAVMSGGLVGLGKRIVRRYIYKEIWRWARRMMRWIGL